MAIGKAKQTKEAQEFKRFIGVTPVIVVKVNPTKKDLESLFGNPVNEEPQYVTMVTDNNGNEFAQARITLVLKSTTDIDMPLITMSFYIQNKPRVGSASGKTQVIDKYGRTAWATPEDLAAHRIPVYSNGPANISEGYRPAYVGEEELTEFTSKYLDIEATEWDNIKRTMVLKKDADLYTCRYDNLANIFKGDFSEIIDNLSFMPTNKIKVMLGVRTDANTGKMYQAVYTRKFVKNESTNYKDLQKEIDNMKNNAAANGRVLNTEYEAQTVHEYVIKPTEFKQQDASEELPFGDTSSNELPWD